ncbi:MAG: hypothetical protein A3A51_01985 [Candidatus Levybacteria bacterium RIFCSPLOWO2_01_FULL_39_10]|nr:MAG: hypothetical protein A3A51_01985 [Candidatus Levybacteria bacterium RIFCSPLOWO2_01_FULL_39_10]
MAQDHYEKIYRSKKQIITNNFLGGLAWGIGITLGLGIFLAILVFIARNIDFVPIFGDFISEVINYTLENAQNSPIGIL